MGRDFLNSVGIYNDSSSHDYNLKNIFLDKTEDTFDESKFIPVTIPVERSRTSRLFSVVFPDRRASQTRRTSAVKLNNERPSSVIDIKGSSRTILSSDSASDLSLEDTPELGKGKNNRESAGSNSNDSFISRARTPFLRISNVSRFGKLSLRFSAFTTTSSAGSDLERGERTPVVPRVPLSSTSGRTTTSVPDIEAQRMPKLPSKALRKASIRSVKAPLAPPPDINVIPASANGSFMLNSVKSDPSILASMPYPDRLNVDANVPSRYDVSSTRSMQAPSIARARSGTMPRMGLPGSPRVLRSAEHGERSKIVMGTP